MVFLPHSLANNKIAYGGEMAGVKALGEMLKVNTTLQSIKCASQTQLPHGHRFTPLGPVDVNRPLHCLFAVFPTMNSELEAPKFLPRC